MRSSQMTILMIGPLPPPYSGPEISMKLFMDSELKDNFHLLFLKTNFRKNNVDKGKNDLAAAFFTLGYFFKLLFFLVFRRPDVAYYPVTPTAGGWLLRDAPTLLLCRLFGIKSIIHLRGSHFRRNYGTFPQWIKKIAARAIRGVSMALVQADYLHEEFADFLPPEKIRTLYQAIDSVNFPPDPAAEKTGMILIVGHLTQAKGYCDMLRVIPLVAAECPEAQFYFAGNIRHGERGVFFNQATGERLVYEDPIDAEQEFLKSPWAGHYHRLGIIAGDEKLKCFQETSVFVMPSYSEGFSRALLEALCTGKAIVYTPVGAHREIMLDGVNGIRVMPGDVENFARAIVRLLKESSERRQMGVHNAEDARKRFDIHVIVRQLSLFFTEVGGQK